MGERDADPAERASGPLPPAAAWRAVGRCVASSTRLLVQRRVHLPREHVGRVIRFGDGTTARVYRETTTTRPAAVAPCFLVVGFRLRLVRGPGHVAFEWESLLNTPLFVGFPGFVSKLWLAHDQTGRYRGLYEWDGAGPASAYAGALWHVLALVSEADSIDYRVLSDVRRDAVLDEPGLLGQRDGTHEWWRPVGMS